MYSVTHARNLCFSQNEGSSDQPCIPAFRGWKVGGALLLREGEAKWGGFLLLHDSALFYHCNGGVHRPTVSMYI